MVVDSGGVITANAMGLEEGAGAPSSDGLRAGAGYGGLGSKGSSGENIF